MKILVTLLGSELGKTSSNRLLSAGEPTYSMLPTPLAFVWSTTMMQFGDLLRTTIKQKLDNL